MKYKHSLLLIFLILIIDQVSKLYIKLNFAIGDYIDVFGTWFKIYFIENEGMAFGYTFSEAPLGKLALTLFRLVAVGFGFYYINQLIKKQHTKGMIVCASLILAGAAGNLIDSLFYGLIFTASTPQQVAEVVSFGEGYAGFMHGKVVDMLYFPLIDTTWPSWVPFVGGDRFEFFQPIFNIADVAISTGVITLLVFQKKYMPSKPAAIKSEESKDTN